MLIFEKKPSKPPLESKIAGLVKMMGREKFDAIRLKVGKPNVNTPGYTTLFLEALCGRTQLESVGISVANRELMEQLKVEFVYAFWYGKNKTQYVFEIDFEEFPPCSIYSRDQN